ncbi:DinB family protein [Allobranchiibius huperziae]|uniref:Putative damage-inducible protein DinB n=1 Tax=Allobranchiibius huperziae TaxID=1874116 RepID=A0A853DHQ6_9MICO|nr:DinB family protein [Allobranchiibius huperziae]NYJ76217.1 putative damage-inducible protein DinB [Allobranchiibius huperziae]
MSADDRARAGLGGTLPPLAGEDFTCERCGLSYPQVSLDRAVALIAGVPDLVRRAVAPLSPEARRRRSGPGLWSVTEYVCHLRDVYAAYTIRLHRARTEDEPVLEPMLNDLRARRFRYNDLDVDAVIAELQATATGFREEVARTGPEHWDRRITRLPGESRTALWLVRQAAHEGQHHLEDIRQVVAHVSGA